jgi:hypothetical protein
MEDTLVSTPLSILLLMGDAEARLLADAESAIQSVLPCREVRLTKAWAVRPDWLDASAPAPPATLRARGSIPDLDARDLLAQPHRLVLFSLFPSVAIPTLRHREGGSFLAHRGLRARWSPAERAAVEAECTLEPPLSAGDAAKALEPIIERLQQRGAAVAVCGAFRHVREPLEHRAPSGSPSLRERVRQTNLEVARLSQRTGCFVLDLDRPLAQQGGASLNVDCFGEPSGAEGGESDAARAAELALEELAGLVLDALPDDALAMEAT